MAGVKPLLETIGALMPKGIKAWHASPHDFDKVDLSKIGTGQGAQSYGPGFYAAESPAVSGVGGEYWKEFARHSDTPYTDVARVIEKHGFSRDAAAEATQKEIDQLHQHLKTGTMPPGVVNKHTDPHIIAGTIKGMINDRTEQLNLLKSNRQIGPRVYELNLKADPRSFLQWDEPFAQQSENVRGALKPIMEQSLTRQQEAQERIMKSGRLTDADRIRLGENIPLPLPEISGKDIYKRLGLPAVTHNEGAQRSMDVLRDAGIPGVRYLDAKSRSLADYSGAQQKDLDEVIAQITKYRAEGNNLRAAELDQHRARMERTLAQPRTYNYVVNNPDIIEIMRKLAIPGVATGGAASVYQPQGQQ